MSGFDEHIVRAESFFYARMLVETNMKSFISKSTVIICENYRSEVVVHKVPICPSAPCSLSNSLEAAVMGDFSAKDGGYGRWKCNSSMAIQQNREPPRILGQRDYGSQG